MSIPGMLASMVGVGVLPEVSIPGMADDVVLDATIKTPVRAPAAARPRTGVTMRRLRVMLVIEESLQKSLYRLVAGGGLLALARPS